MPPNMLPIARQPQPLTKPPNKRRAGRDLRLGDGQPRISLSVGVLVALDKLPPRISTQLRPALQLTRCARDVLYADAFTIPAARMPSSPV